MNKFPFSTLLCGALFLGLIIGVGFLHGLTASLTALLAGALAFYSGKGYGYGNGFTSGLRWFRATEQEDMLLAAMSGSHPRIEMKPIEKEIIQRLVLRVKTAVTPDEPPVAGLAGIKPADEPKTYEASSTDLTKTVAVFDDGLKKTLGQERHREDKKQESPPTQRGHRNRNSRRNKNKSDSISERVKSRNPD